MTNGVVFFEKAQFAGQKFRTMRSQINKVHDDTCIRMDYKAPGRAGGRNVLSAYARIQNMFVHHAYPGGPSRVVVEGDWYRVKGKCEVAGTTLVIEDQEHDFNTSSKYVFLQSCYERPVAFWPYDPLNKLDADHPRKKWLDVIDRNQNQSY